MKSVKSLSARANISDERTLSKYARSSFAKGSFIVAVGLASSAIDGAAWASASTHQHKVAPSSKHLYMYAPDPLDQSNPGAARDPAKPDAAREEALRECSGAARKYTERHWVTLVAGT